MAEQEAPFAFEEAGIDLEQRAEEALTRASNRTRAGDPFAEIDKKLDDALAEAKTIEAKKIAVRDIRLTIDQVIADQNQDARDLNEVTASLHALAKEQGAQLANLETLHPEAKKIIEEAEAEAAAAQVAVTEATSQLAVAEAKTQGPFGLVGALNGRSTAISAAQGALNRANERKRLADTAVEEAPAKADRKHRDILMNASMEESNMHIRAMHERANDILRENIESAGLSLERREQVIAASRDRHKAAIEEYDQATKDFKVQETTVNDLEAQLEELERNTPAYAELDAQLSTAREELGRLKAKIDASTGEAQELEEKLKTLEIQRDALITVKGNYERSLRIGVAAAKLNAEVAAVRIELMQGLSDLQIQNELSSVSRTETVKAAQAAADTINAVERARVKYSKQHPEVMMAQKKILDNLEGMMDILSEEDRALLDAWRKEVLTGETDDSSAPAGGDSSNAEQSKEFTF